MNQNAMTSSDLISTVFREAFRNHPAGVAIVTADPGDGPVAMTVSSLISVSAEPPTVAFSISSASSAGPVLLRAKTLVIHLLRFRNLELARMVSARGSDRFGPGVAWERLPTGEPRYTEVATWFRAETVGVLPLEGASLLAARLIEGEVSPSDVPETESLVYLDRRWHRLDGV